MNSDRQHGTNTAALFARASRGSNRVIVPINNCAVSREFPRASLYCVHSVSGAAGIDFVDLANRLDPTVRFYGIQAPPKQMEDVEFGRSIESLAEHYAAAVVEFQPSGPVLLAGYCVGVVIALEMANILRARGREVGPLIVLDGIVENTGVDLRRRTPSYWLEVAKKLTEWLRHADLMRNLSFVAVIRSIANNLVEMGKRLMGVKRYEKLRGGYAIDGWMDTAKYPPLQTAFINRLFAAVFAYTPKRYAAPVIVYEAKISPLLDLPETGRIWRHFAPQSEIMTVLGTHLGMIREPYVDVLARDLQRRIHEFFEPGTAAFTSTRAESGHIDHRQALS